MQEIMIRMHSGDVARTPIYKLANGYRADIDYQRSKGAAFDPTEGPVCNTPFVAFEWAVGTTMRIAEVCFTSIAEVANPSNVELLSAQDQKTALQNRGVDAVVTINGQPVFSGL